MLLTLFRVVLFGIVEGITEWLPISSTGHMILLHEWLPLPFEDAFLSFFLVVIQLGAILAVVCLFWYQIWPFRWEIKNGVAFIDKGQDQRSAKKLTVKREIVRMWWKIAVACLPAVLVELLWGDMLEDRFYHPASVAGALIIVGVLFILIERMQKRKLPIVVETDAITWQMAFFIGVCQAAAAAFPGTSRSGATIIGALLIGIARPAAAAFTFFMAVPVMAGASLMKMITCPVNWNWEMAIYTGAGMLTAFIVSLAVIRFLMDYVQKHDFSFFGWYRIVLGILILYLL